MDGMFITLPTVLDVRLCLMMNGQLCMFKQALYPVEHTNCCIYALFINDEKQIEKNCFLKTINTTTNLAYRLDGYLWAISALAAEKLQIRCVMETHVTGGSCLSWIFWEHENQSGLLVIWLIYIKLYRKKETKFWKKNPG